MMNYNKRMLVEAALAGLFATSLVGVATAKETATPDRKAPSPRKAAEKIHCFGVNSCKGRSECAVDGKSQCNGQNACKGQGWISLTRKVCMKKSGHVLGELNIKTQTAPVKK